MNTSPSPTTGRYWPRPSHIRRGGLLSIPVMSCSSALPTPFGGFGLRPHLPAGEGKRGRPAHDNRRFIDAVCWILRTGAPWRDLPPDYGDWKNTHRRFCRWRDRGVWAGLLEAVMDAPDFEWLMIDASYIKAHPHSAGARGGNQSIARTKGG